MQGEEDALEPQQHRLVLSSLGLALLTQGRLEAALLRLVEADERFPGDPVVTYNIGCTLALLKRPDEAMEHVARALAAEPQLVDHAKGDPDLERLRGRADWQRLLQRLPPAGEGDAAGDRSGVIP